MVIIMKNKSFLNSFLHAVDGIFEACREERNMRFHIVTGVLICVFAHFYGLTSSEWAVLGMAITIVIAAELINTAVERTVDTATEEIRETARVAKDAAAGAGFVSAVGAVFIGVCLFGDAARITYALKTIFTDLQNMIICGTAFAMCIIFLILTNRKGKE